MDVLPVGERCSCREVGDIHHDLETVEALGLGGLDLGRESLDKVLVDDTIRLKLAYSEDSRGATYGSKESKNVLDEVSLVVVELVVPIVKIRGEIDLFGGPETVD